MRRGAGGLCPAEAFPVFGREPLLAGGNRSVLPCARIPHCGAGGWVSVQRAHATTFAAPVGGAAAAAAELAARADAEGSGVRRGRRRGQWASSQQQKSETRRPKPERRPKSEGRRDPAASTE